MIHISMWPCDNCGSFPGGFWHGRRGWSHDVFCLGGWKDNNDPISQRTTTSLWQRFWANSSETMSSRTVRSSSTWGHPKPLLFQHSKDKIIPGSVPNRFWLRLGLTSDVISNKSLAKWGCVDGYKCGNAARGNLSAMGTVKGSWLLPACVCCFIDNCYWGRNYHDPFLK